MSFFNDIFSRGNKSDDQKRLAEMVEKASKASPTAKKMLDDAKKRGIKFEMDKGVEGARGYYTYDSKTVFLNPKFSDDILLSTLIHEVRHSEQALDFSSTNTIQSAIKVNRAAEADAMAFSCMAAYEMGRTMPEVFTAYKKENPDIANAFAAELQQTRSQNRSLQAAFKAWYKDADYVGTYDNDVISHMKKVHSGSRSLKEIPDTDIARKMCKNGTLSYLSDIPFLSSQAATTISVKNYESAAKIEKKGFLGTTHSKRLTSIDNFYVRQEDGRVRMPLIPRKAPPQARPMTPSQISSVIDGYFR